MYLARRERKKYEPLTLQKSVSMVTEFGIPPRDGSSNREKMDTPEMLYVNNVNKTVTSHFPVSIVWMEF
jgi:hypothetical protein